MGLGGAISYTLGRKGEEELEVFRSFRMQNIVQNNCVVQKDHVMGQEYCTNENVIKLNMNPN